MAFKYLNLDSRVDKVSVLLKAKMIKQIWIEMGKPDTGNLATKLGFKDRHSIIEHLSLIEETPKERAILKAK